MNDFLLTTLFTLVLGAGNSVFHGEQLLKIEETQERIDNSKMYKVLSLLQIIFTPIILYVGYILAKKSLLLLFIGIILNIMPLTNAFIIMVANIVVIPMSLLIAKLLGVRNV